MGSNIKHGSQKTSQQQKTFESRTPPPINEGGRLDGSRQRRGDREELRVVLWRDSLVLHPRFRSLLDKLSQTKGEVHADLAEAGRTWRDARVFGDCSKVTPDFVAMAGANEPDRTVLDVEAHHVRQDGLGDMAVALKAQE